MRSTPTKWDTPLGTQYVIRSPRYILNRNLDFSKGMDMVCCFRLQICYKEHVGNKEQVSHVLTLQPWGVEGRGDCLTRDADTISVSNLTEVKNVMAVFVSSSLQMEHECLCV